MRTVRKVFLEVHEYVVLKSYKTIATVGIRIPGTVQRYFIKPTDGTGIIPIHLKNICDDRQTGHDGVPISR